MNRARTIFRCLMLGFAMLTGLRVFASPVDLAEDLAALVAEGRGVLMPNLDEAHVEYRGVQVLPGDFPGDFLLGLVPIKEHGITVYPIAIRIDDATGNAVFYNANADSFYTVPRIAPSNWLALLHPLFPSNPWYAESRVIAQWTLVPASSLDDYLAAANPPPPSLRSSPAPVSLEVTNLTFTAISVSESNVVLDVAWPTNDIPPDGILDLYFKPNLTTNVWTLLDTATAVDPTNVTFTVDGADLPDFIRETPSHIHDASCLPITNIIQSVFLPGSVETNIVFSCQTNPPAPPAAGFFRVGTRQDSDDDGIPDAFETMVLGTDPLDSLDAFADSDGDGLPNIYEFVHGTNPLVPDWANAPKITVGGPDADFATLYAAFAVSEPYDIIEIQPGVYPMSACGIPIHPVLVSSPDGGRRRGVVLRSSSSGDASWVLGAEDGTGRHSVIQGITVELTEGPVWQTAFWWGGSLDFPNHPGASGCFRNVEVRLGSGTGTRIGWFIRHSTSDPVLFAGCVVDAEGTTSARGVYAVDSPELILENCTFRAFPDASETAAYALQLESSADNIGAATNPIPVLLRNCLFDTSFTNALALAPLTNGVAYATAMDHCLVPTTLEYPPNSEIGTITTSVSVDRHGHLLSASTPAIGAGVAPRFASNDIDGEPFAPLPSIGADEWSDGMALDSDGDGLTNADEAERTHTDPFLMDTDGDGYDDFFEDSHGSDPLDRLSFCFTLSVSVGNVALHGCTNAYLAVMSVATNGTANVLGNLLGVSETPNAIYDFGHILSAGTEPDAFQMVFFLDADEDGLPNIPETFATIPFSVSAHEVVIDMALPIGDADNDGMLDLWEIMNGLSVTNALDAAENPDGDGLVNLHEYWADCDPWTVDGTNTLLSVIATSIDSRIAGKNSTTAKPIYNDYASNAAIGVFDRNTNSWTYGIDISCASPWNTGKPPAQHATTLISPRHVIGARHHGPVVGSTYYFHATNDFLYSATIDATNYVEGTDIVIGRLDVPISNVIRPARILPPDYADYIGNGKFLPALGLDQQEKGLVFEIESLGGTNALYNPFVQIRSANTGHRALFRENLVGGDSGNPVFLVLKNEVVLLYSFFHADGDGLGYVWYRESIQTAMDELLPGFVLREMDFSSYDPIGENTY